MRYNQKGGWTVVVRVVVVLAGRGGAAPSALVSCFRLSAPRNALRDSFRSNFTFGQTCPRMNKNRAASPKAQATDNARRRRRCKGCCRGCCPCLASLAASDMIITQPRPTRVRCTLLGQLLRLLKLCVTFTEHPNAKSDLELVCIEAR